MAICRNSDVVSKTDTLARTSLSREDCRGGGGGGERAEAGVREEREEDGKEFKRGAEREEEMSRE